MNEEEKQAILKLKRVINKDTGFISDDIQDDEIETILGLINKQQKEIEDLKDKCKELIFEKQELTSALLDSIPEDKIKEKIEEITSYAYTSAEERDYQDYAIQILKELLGE